MGQLYRTLYLVPDRNAVNTEFNPFVPISNRPGAVRTRREELKPV